MNRIGSASARHLHRNPRDENRHRDQHVCRETRPLRSGDLDISARRRRFVLPFVDYKWRTTYALARVLFYLFRNSHSSTLCSSQKQNWNDSNVDSPRRRLVNHLCTRSKRSMSVIKWGDHTHDAYYSNNGRTYTVKARQSKDTSLDTVVYNYRSVFTRKFGRHFFKNIKQCIRLALAEARVVILFMWLVNFRLRRIWLFFYGVHTGGSPLDKPFTPTASRRRRTWLSRSRLI